MLNLILMGNAGEGNRSWFLLLRTCVLIEGLTGSGKMLHGPPITEDSSWRLFFQEEEKGVCLGGLSSGRGLPPKWFECRLPTAVPFPQPGPHHAKFGLGRRYRYLLPVNLNRQPFQPIPMGDKIIKISIRGPLA